jgi:hypothetical protein
MKYLLPIAVAGMIGLFIYSAVQLVHAYQEQHHQQTH